MSFTTWPPLIAGSAAVVSQDLEADKVCMALLRVGGSTPPAHFAKRVYFGLAEVAKRLSSAPLASKQLAVKFKRRYNRLSTFQISLQLRLWGVVAQQRSKMSKNNNPTASS